MSSVITRKSVIALSMQIIICSSPCKSGRVRSWTIVVVESGVMFLRRTPAFHLLPTSSMCSRTSRFIWCGVRLFAMASSLRPHGLDALIVAHEEGHKNGRSYPRKRTARLGVSRVSDSLPEARRELAEFLRTRRARLSPEQIGFPAGTRRRTPGLRREEVAQRAAVSPSLYTWLEQGREIRVSPQVLESLARALQLDRSEREHLFLLAGQPVPLARPAPAEAVSPALQQILDQQGIAPAHITGRRWDILAWNRPAATVLEDFGAVSALERNTIWRIFTNPVVRRVIVDWEDTARGLLAYFRMSYSRNIGDPSFTELIDALMEASPEFRDWWPRHDVLSTPDGRKVLNHPVVGRLLFELTTLQVYDALDLKLCIYVPVAESGTIEKLRQMLGDDAKLGRQAAKPKAQVRGS